VPSACPIVDGGRPAKRSGGSSISKPQATDLGLQEERVTRIELALSAWEATAPGEQDHF
jgi:hypothetical protein